MEKVSKAEGLFNNRIYGSYLFESLRNATWMLENVGLPTFSKVKMLGSYPHQWVWRHERYTAHLSFLEQQ